MVFAAKNFDTKETGQRAMEFGSEFRSKYVNDSMKIYNEIRFVFADSAIYLCKCTRFIPDFLNSLSCKLCMHTSLPLGLLITNILTTI